MCLQGGFRTRNCKYQGPGELLMQVILLLSICGCKYVGVVRGHISWVGITGERHGIYARSGTYKRTQGERKVNKEN